MGIKERIIYLMGRRDIKNAAELSRLTGLTPVAIRNYMRGIKVPNAQALIKLARALDTTADFLLSGTAVRPDRIPLLSKIPGGYPMSFSDGDYPPGFADDYVDRGDTTDPNAFALTVDGDSMSPRINHGDIVIISPNAPFSSGCIAAVALDEDRTLKKVIELNGDAILLQPENPNHNPIVVPRGKVIIIGRVVERREKM
jgi:SOS-response transcriptional repressor LexA